MGCPCAGKDTKQEIGVNIPLKSVSVAGYSLGLMGGVRVGLQMCFGRYSAAICKQAFTY